MKNKNDSDNSNSPDETEPKTRTPKNMKTIKTVIVKDGTHENESEPVDHESIDQFEEEVDKDNKDKKDNKESKENIESPEP